MTENKEASKGDQSKYKAPKDFDNLELSELGLFTEAERNHGTNHYSVNLPIQVKGENFNMLCDMRVEKNKQNEIYQLTLKISIVAPDKVSADLYGLYESILYGEIDINSPSNFNNLDLSRTEATTVVQKNRGAGNIAPETGVALYNKMIDFIAKQSELSKQDITHKITYAAFFGLTPEKWLKIFGPILEERGYTQIDNKHWEKIYKFNQK